MALATAPTFASFDVTSRTEGRAVDSNLWDYMFAKSRALEVVGTGPKINQQRYEWVNLGAPTITLTETTDAGGDEVPGSASNVQLNVASGEGAKVMAGSLLMNATRATPIGTYQRNEILQVTAVTTDALTVVRDIGAFNSGTGSTAHTATDKFRVISTPHQEGSVASLDPNKYVAQSILENYSSIQAIKFQVTGSQLARDMEVVASDMERQYAREMLQLKNELVSILLYGFNSSTAVGSDTVIRQNNSLILKE